MRRIIFMLAVIAVMVSCKNDGNQATSKGKNGTVTFSDNKATISVNGVTYNLIKVEGGTFQMGSEESYCGKPVHSVTLSDYYIGETEVTEAFWTAVAGGKGEWFQGDNYPAGASWDACEVFLKDLELKTGVKFTLPTEAQWEYAARGGNKSLGYIYSGSNSIDDVAWYKNNSSGQIHPVGMKQPNELGIYDMSGNMWEWCQDWYTENYPSTAQTDPTGPETGGLRLIRGAAYNSEDYQCHVAYRHYRYYPYDDNTDQGFRLVLVK